LSDILLSNLKVGQSAKVISCDTGSSCQERLKALGLVKGKIVKKVSNLKMRGPIVLEVDRAKVAVGRGMANKILVKVLENE
jgi:ferrous iron transport protein A